MYVDRKNPKNGTKAEEGKKGQSRSSERGRLRSDEIDADTLIAELLGSSTDEAIETVLLSLSTCRCSHESSRSACFAGVVGSCLYVSD